MKLILHIGTEKTGTTQLQNWLYDNTDSLSALGVAVNNSLGKGNNRKLVAYFQARKDDYFKRHKLRSQAAIEAFFEGFEADLSQEITAASEKHHTYVISSEHFHSRLHEPDGIAKLANFLGSLFEEIQVVCYLRSQAEMRQSLYSTAVKNGYCGLPDEFHANHGPNKLYYNYEKLLGYWQQYFGNANVTPVIYDRKALLQQDIRHDFMGRFLPEVDITKLSFGPVFSNPKLSLLQVEAIRTLNRMFGEAPTPKAEKRLHRLVKSIIHSVDLNLGDIRFNDSVAFQARFDAINQTMFERYGLGENVFASERLAQKLAPSGEENKDIHYAIQAMQQLLELTVRVPQD